MALPTWKIIYVLDIVPFIEKKLSFHWKRKAKGD